MCPIKRNINFPLSFASLRFVRHVEVKFVQNLDRFQDQVLPQKANVAIIGNTILNEQEENVHYFFSPSNALVCLKG